MPSDAPPNRRAGDAQLLALGGRLRDVETRLGRVEQREGDLMRAVDTLRLDVRGQVQHMQQVIDDDRAYIRGSLDAINTTLGEIRMSEARVSGGVTVLRMAWRLLAASAAMLGITVVAVKGWLSVFADWLLGR